MGDGSGHADVAIIGGGIVGTSAAALLAQAGVRVILHEREGLGAGASGRNSGVVQRPFDRALAPIHAETITLYRQLEAAGVGFALGDEPAGLLLVSPHEGLVRRLADGLVVEAPDLAAVALDEAALHELEPSLAPGLTACRVDIGYPVPPASATYAWASLAERLGVSIRLGREAVPASEGGRIVGVRVDGRLEAAGAVLVAAGPWSPGLLDPTGRWRPIRPLWGVVVDTLLADPPRHVLEEAEMDEALGTGGVASEAGVPRADHSTTPEFSLVTAAGVSCVGSTFLEAEPDLEDWEVRILERGSAFVPAIADAPIRGIRSCARPASVDGRPFVGVVPGVDGLYLCAGHGAWGISTGPGSARLVADAILGRRPNIPAELDAGRSGSPFG